MYFSLAYFGTQNSYIWSTFCILFFWICLWQKVLHRYCILELKFFYSMVFLGIELFMLPPTPLHAAAAILHSLSEPFQFLTFNHPTPFTTSLQYTISNKIFHSLLSSLFLISSTTATLELVHPKRSCRPRPRWRNCAPPSSPRTAPDTLSGTANSSWRKFPVTARDVRLWGCGCSLRSRSHSNRCRKNRLSSPLGRAKRLRNTRCCCCWDTRSSTDPRIPN